MIFFLHASKYRCYFCSFKCNELDKCVNHCVTHHSDKQVTIWTYVLDTVSGLLGYQIKRYPVVPGNLPNDKFVGVIGDKVKKKMYTPVHPSFTIYKSEMPTIFQSFWDNFLGLTSSKQNG